MALSGDSGIARFYPVGGDQAPTAGFVQCFLKGGIFLSPDMSSAGFTKNIHDLFIRAFCVPGTGCYAGF